MSASRPLFFVGMPATARPPTKADGKATGAQDGCGCSVSELHALPSQQRCPHRGRPAKQATPAPGSEQPAGSVRMGMTSVPMEGGIGSSPYNPETPWGARGIAYDPASPYWTWKPPQQPCSPDGVDRSIFDSLRAAASLMSPETLRGHEDRLEREQTGEKELTASSVAILRILRDITDQKRGSESLPSANQETNGGPSSVADVRGYVDNRFVLNSAVGKGLLPYSGGKRYANGTAANGNAADSPAVSSGRSKQKNQQTSPTHPDSGRSLDSSVPRCCPVEVPNVLHMILDKVGDKLDPRMVEHYSGFADKLCASHLEKYRQLQTSMARDRSLRNAERPGTPQTPQTPKAPQPAQEVQTSPRLRLKQAAKRPLASRRSTPPQPQVSPLTPLLPSAPPLLPPLSVSPPPAAAAAADSPASSQPRVPVAATCSQNGQSKPRKRRASADPLRPPRNPRAVSRSHVRPVPNVIRDHQYRVQALAEIQERLTRASSEQSCLTHGCVANQIVLNLLTVAVQPNVSPERGPVDAHFLTGEEARAMLDAGSPAEPVVTEKEQSFRWQPRLRPIAELFRRMENLDRQVSVQVPSRSCMTDSFESQGLVQVRDRFLGEDVGGSSGRGNDHGGETDDPWNILDLRSPLPAAVLPQFLTCENCQLLPRLRDEVLNPNRAERDTSTREQWNEWRDILEWVLLSQGGHNTSPHTDSHGLGTWITVQEGLFGYGWLSRPTAEERDGWMADPHSFTGGRWCYLILEPGQTVFFNSGTVHFVFRLRSEHTLALGGHILQWTGIERWLQVVAAQMRNPHITNEDMEWSAPKYVRIVAHLVEVRLRNGRVAELGGEAAACRLLALLKEFDDANVVKERSSRGRPKKKRQR